MNIKELFERAKQDIVRHGEYTPTMKVEADIGDIVTFEFEELPEETPDKEKMFFRHGREYGVKHKGVELRQIAFISEAWAGYKPDRKEVIIISVLSIDNKKYSQEMWTAEMVRAGGIVDLLPQEKMGGADNYLLTAFLSGFASSGMSDVELAQFVVQQYEQEGGNT